jgi:hypothetical protein
MIPKILESSHILIKSKGGNIGLFGRAVRLKQF